MEAMRQKAAEMEKKRADESFTGEAPIIQRAAVLGKAVAGGIRCFFEDLYSGGLQLIYLCKIWHNKDVTGAAKAFTMVSVITSGLCSLAGPLAALFQYYMLSDAAKAAEGNGDRQKELKRKHSLGPRRRRKLSRGGEWEDTTTDQEEDNW